VRAGLKMRAIISGGRFRCSFERTVLNGRGSGIRTRDPLLPNKAWLG
jgi:hypothetical protein